MGHPVSIVLRFDESRFMQYTYAYMYMGHHVSMVLQFHESGFVEYAYTWFHGSAVP